MSLASVVSKHMTRVTTTNGKVGRGQLLEIPDTTRVTNMNPIRRLFRVEPNSPLTHNDIIILPDTSKFILAKHGVAWSTVKLYQQFMLFEMTDQWEWKFTKVAKDPVTGLEIPGSSTPTLIWIATRSLSDVTDREIGVSVDTDEIITDAKLSPGDRVDGRAVVDVSQQLGITVATIQHG